MATMELKYNKTYNALMITHEEVLRLAEEAAKGEPLIWEGELGWIKISGGMLTACGFDSVPALFAFEGKDWYSRPCIEFLSEKTEPLKSRVNRIIVSEGTRELDCSFIGFSELSTVVLPDSIEQMDNPFAYCKKLKPYALPAGLVSIRGAIYGEAPEELVIPEGVMKISNGGFTPHYHNMMPFAELSIKRAVLPSTLEKISDLTFLSCKSLEQVAIPEGVRVICGGAFSGCKALREVTLPGTLELIEGGAFRDCSSLSKLNISSPDTCEIEPYAFRGAPCECVVQRLRMAKVEPIPYTADMGEIQNFEEMCRILSGKPMSEQFAHFSVIESSGTGSYSYGKLDSSSEFEQGSPFPADCVEKMIACDGILVGAVVDGCNVIVGHTVCTYDATDGDGTGSRTRTDYCSIVFSADPREGSGE